ncbi:MAG: hypothetical protein M3Y35_00825 [Actinomycetota bacterium]|nr:hypothetical protein [Actinomycetota bacterium]
MRRRPVWSMLNMLRSPGSSGVDVHGALGTGLQQWNRGAPGGELVLTAAE